MQHRLPQRLHGIAVRLVQQRDAVHVQQLVVSPQPLVSRRRSAVYNALDENPEVLGSARLALDADSKPGLLRIVHWDVEGQDLAVFPGENHGIFRFVQRLLKIEL